MPHTASAESAAPERSTVIVSLKFLGCIFPDASRDLIFGVWGPSHKVLGSIGSFLKGSLGFWV